MAQALGPSSCLPHVLSSRTSVLVIMNTMGLLVLSGLTVFACDAQQLRGSASSEDVSMNFGNSTNVTLGSTSGSCDTSGWDSHFASDTHACGMQSLGQQQAAGNCARGKFGTSWQCGNCMNEYSCKKCASDNCVWKLQRCSGGFVPSGYW